MQRAVEEWRRRLGRGWGRRRRRGREKREPASAPQEPGRSSLTASRKASTGAWSDPDEQ